MMIREWALRGARDQVASLRIVVHEHAQFSDKFRVVFVVSALNVQVNTIHYSTENETTFHFLLVRIGNRMGASKIKD